MKRDSDLIVDKMMDTLYQAGWSRQEITRVINYRKDLRDEFAIAALPVLISGSHPKDGREIAAGEAYKYADAMMEQRNK